MTSFGYARVSTADQNTVDQERMLRQAGCELVFRDVASGERASRPGLNEMLASLGHGDSVTVVRLDRLGRSMLHTASLVDKFRNEGVSFRSLNDGIDAGTPAGGLMIGLLASIAQYERELIRERTTAGLRTARAQGRYGGRPRAIDGPLGKRLRELIDRGFRPPEIAKQVGVSRTTAYKYVQQISKERSLDT
ncbi:recombinase family protein [Rothia sp. AR01]|uniref:Recombinase family protein n=1 Tax=Rothia santali TaxID=2949643 RepID=A0A9X2KIC0_9MICC|nr:recombinase family protein [Rothia santali]MCP3425845.1 recombinase family protein [Rothia santali]